MTYIAIAEISSGEIHYAGTSVSTAAVNLNPGTCWARGDFSTEAMSLAKAAAATFRQGGYKYEFTGKRTLHRYRGSTKA